jgi:hypothetical protein
MRVLEVTNNDTGDPYIWLIREQGVDQPIGIVLPVGDLFRAHDHANGLEPSREAGCIRYAVQSLYELRDIPLRVNIAPDITKTGIPGDEPLDPTLFGEE